MGSTLIYTIAEAVRACIGVSRTRLFDGIRNGTLKSFKCGKRRLIHREDLGQWIGSMRCNQQVER